jgi:hypothetical protein
VSRRVELVLSDEEFARLERERGLVSRSAWIRSRLFGECGSGAASGVPSPARPVAAPSSSPVLMARSSEKALSMVPGVVRGSSLAKREVRPIPKGKGK